MNTFKVHTIPIPETGVKMWQLLFELIRVKEMTTFTSLCAKFSSVYESLIKLRIILIKSPSKEFALQS